MKDSLKIYETMEERKFPRISWSPLIAVAISACRKKLSSKVTVSIRETNPSPIDRIKDSFKNTFPLDRKKAFPGRNLWNSI